MMKWSGNPLSVHLYNILLEKRHRANGVVFFCGKFLPFQMHTKCTEMEKQVKNIVRIMNSETP